MKKITTLILTLFIGFSALGQQTYFPATPPSTTPLTGLQYRYKSITPDSLNQLFMYWNGKYNRMFTATETNQLLKIYAKKDSVNQAIANLLPGVTSGQMIVGDGIGGYRAINRVDTGTYVNTAGELAAALDIPTPTQGQIFQTWQRLAHGGRSNNPTQQQLNDTIPSNPGQTQSWSYDSVTNIISSTFNSGQLLAFISPNKYTNYTLTSTLKSTDTDNDRIGIALAAINDPNDMVRNNAFGLDSASYPGINTIDSLIPNQHTLTMLINRDPALPKYAIWYDYGKLSRQLIVDGSTSPGLWGTNNDWLGASVDIKVIRRGDSLFVTRSQFSDAPGGKGALGFELAISLTQNPVLYKFRAGASYGFAVNSQAFSTFENVVFTGGTANTIVDIANNEVYIPNGTGGYALDTVTAKHLIYNGQIVFNKTSGKWWLKGDDFLELPNSAGIPDSLATRVAFFPTIAAMQASNTAVNTAVVQDARRGGIFNHVASGLTVDNGVVFSATGKGGYWQRQFSGSTVYPEWWGAVADGVTQSRSPIQAASDYATSMGGGTVQLMSGDYLVRKAQDTSRTIIQLKSNVNLMGMGIGVTRIINDPTTPPQIDSIRYGTQIIRTGEILNSAKNINVENLTLIGNSSIINAGQASASPIRGIGNVIQSTNTIPDTAALYKSHIDNVTIRKVAIYDTYNAIMNGRSILRPTGGGGGGGGTPFMRSTDSAYFHRNWLISDVYINGVGNRAIELSDTKDSRIENSRFFGAGFIHLLRYDFNITIEGNYMNVGADAYTNDRQGYTTAATQEAAGIYLNYGLHDIDIRNNIIEMNPNLNPAIVAAAPFFIRYESGIGADYPQTTRIRSSGNIYRNTISAHKQAVRIVSPTTSIIKVTDFSFTNDTFEGVVRLRGAASDTAITVRNWTFSNSKIDSVIFVTKASTRNSGGFTFKNGTTFNKSFSVSASNVNISNSIVNGTATFASSADSLVLDNFKGTKSINTATPLPLLLNMPYLSSTATNANYTVQYANQIVNLPVITNARNITMPTNSIYNGQNLIFNNANNSAFAWTFSTPVTDAQGNSVTTLPNNSTSILYYNNAWKLTSLSEFTSNGTGNIVRTTSPAFLGTPTATTAAANTNNTQISTTAYADAKVANSLTASTTIAPSATAVNTALATKGSGTVTSVSVTTANGISGSVATSTTTPAITLTLGAITPTSTNGVSAATMAFVDPTSSIQGQFNAKAPLANPTFTGTPAVPTPASDINTTQVVNGAWVNTYYSKITNPYYSLGVLGTNGRSKFGNATAYISTFNADGSQDDIAGVRFNVSGNELQLRYQPSVFGTGRFAAVSPSTGAQDQIAYISDIALSYRFAASGTGAATTIAIPHGLSGVTSASIVNVTPINSASAGISYVTADALFINIIYTVAPASGTNNLSYNVSIKK